jgi:AraC family transcriptional regulator
METSNSRTRWEGLAESAHYNARELARLCDLSLRQLQRRFRREFGRSPQDWLNEKRLLAARTRLLCGEPVKRVALELGFKQPSHFCREFKRMNHMTPSEFVLTQSGRDAKCRREITNVVSG